MSKQETSERQKTDLAKFVGMPWEPCPEAKGGFELRSKVRLPADQEDFTEIVKGKGGFKRRRFIT